MESKKQIYRVSFTIDEIRPLVLRYLDTAQNIENSDCLMHNLFHLARSIN